MEVKILEETKNRIKVEIKDENHTLLNALRNELWNNRHTKVAGYRLEHPLVSSPVLILEADDKPRNVLLDSINKLKKKNSEFRDLFKKLK